MEFSIFQVVYINANLLQNMKKEIKNMSNIKVLLGKKLKFYREKANLTQEQLAEKIGINSRSVSLIERWGKFYNCRHFRKNNICTWYFSKSTFWFRRRLYKQTKSKRKII